MSFISDEEAKQRLNSPSNVLSRADRPVGELAPVDLDSILIPIESADPLNDFLPSPDEIHKKNQARATSDSFDPFAALKTARSIDEGTNQKGRKAFIRNRTTEENAAVGLTSLLLGSTASEEMFGVQGPQQSLIKQGMTGSLDRKQGRAPKQDLLDSIYSHGKKASDKAFEKLFKTLDCLTDDKLQNVSKATDLSKIATNMARIVQSVTPKDSGEADHGVHFHIYAPEQNEITDYDAVTVRPDGSVDAEIINDGTESGPAI